MVYNLFLEKVLLPIGDLLIGSSFISELKKVRAYELLTHKEVENKQKEKLRDLLDFVTSESPYYQPFAGHYCMDPLAFLKKMPIMDKVTLHSETNAILTKPKEELIKQSSSGSSGIQTTVYFDKREQSVQRAYQVRWWEWAGYKIGDALLQTGMNPKRGFIKSVKDFLFRTKYFKAFTYKECEVNDVLNWASDQREITLAGYASSLYVLAQFGEHKNISFKTIIVWGDKLFSHYRKLLENVFGAKVYETYAASEGFMIAAQKDLSYLYLMSLNVYVELLDDDGCEVEEGEIGHVVVTKLDGYSMPLIRYRIGDLAIKLPRCEYPIKKDLPYPLLQTVIGRDTDIVKTRLGQFMVVHTFTGIFEYYPQIEQFRVIQHDLNGIVIEYIPRLVSDVTQELDAIKDKLSETLGGENFKIDFVEVEKILPTSSGKPQIIQSYLDKGDLGTSIP